MATLNIHYSRCFTVEKTFSRWDLRRVVILLYRHNYLNKVGCVDQLGGPVHAYADIFENGGFFLRRTVASTRERRFRPPKTEVSQNALQRGDFRKRRVCVYVWTGENKGFQKR